MKRLPISLLFCLLRIIDSQAQLVRFHYVLPQTNPPTSQPKPPETAPVIIKRRASAVSQNYPHVLSGSNIRFLYRSLTGDKAAAPIYTGQPNIWATVKMDNTVPVVDIWQFNQSDEGVRDNLIRCSTDLKSHRIEIDLSRDSVGGATRVVKIPFRAFLVSYNTVPLRFRWAGRSDHNPSPATTNLSFAVNVGGVRGNSYFSPRSVRHYGYALSVFAGATTVTLDRPSYLNQSQYDMDRTNLGLSGGLSFTFIRNNIGLVAALGIDHCTGHNHSEWVYQDRPWLGIGISTGLGLF
ncbi:MAG: hypothetical protein ACRYFZ_14465 [Janthinobacterium lividum]